MAAHVDDRKVAQALETLRSVVAKYHAKSARSKKSLIDDDSSCDNIYLQLTLKKIPYNANPKLIKIDLPHTLVSDDTDICLFVRDLERGNARAEYEKTVDHYKARLEAAGVTHNIDVIPLRQVRTEYQPYEAKRNLCAGYDVFLADQLIYPVLARTIGKTFYVKNKLPRKVDMKRKNLKSHIEHVLSTTYLMLRCEGTASTVMTAHLGLSDSETIENVWAVCQALEKKTPGGWDNILSLHVKTHKSIALPLYMSFDSRNNVFIEVPLQKRNVFRDNISTVPGGKVAVSPFGKVKLRRDKEEKVDEEGKRILGELMQMQGKERKEAELLEEEREMGHKALLETAFRNAKEPVLTKRQRDQKRLQRKRLTAGPDTVVRKRVERRKRREV